LCWHNASIIGKSFDCTPEGNNFRLFVKIRLFGNFFHQGITRKTNLSEDLLGPEKVVMVTAATLITS